MQTKRPVTWGGYRAKQRRRLFRAVALDGGAISNRGWPGGTCNGCTRVPVAIGRYLRPLHAGTGGHREGLATVARGYRWPIGRCLRRLHAGTGGHREGLAGVARRPGRQVDRQANVQEAAACFQPYSFGDCCHGAVTGSLPPPFGPLRSRQPGGDVIHERPNPRREVPARGVEKVQRNRLGDEVA